MQKPCVSKEKSRQGPLPRIHELGITSTPTEHLDTMFSFIGAAYWVVQKRVNGGHVLHSNCLSILNALWKTISYTPVLSQTILLLWNSTVFTMPFRSIPQSPSRFSCSMGFLWKWINKNRHRFFAFVAENLMQFAKAMNTATCRVNWSGILCNQALPT